MQFIKDMIPTIMELIMAVLIITCYVAAGIVTSISIVDSTIHDVVIALSLIAAFYTLALVAKKQSGGQDGY